MQRVDREFTISLLNLLGYVDVHNTHRYPSRARVVTALENQFVLRPNPLNADAHNNKPLRWAFVYTKKTHVSGSNTGDIVFKGRHDEAVKWLKTHPYTEEQDNE